MASYERVEIPDIGDFSDVPVIEILVDVGEAVEVDSPLLTLESDKAAMDVPSPLAGRVQEILVNTGDAVSQGTPVMLIERFGSSRPQVDKPASLAAEVASIAAELDVNGSTDAEGGSPQPGSPVRREASTDNGEPAPQTGTGAVKTQTVPDIGDFSGVEIIELHVAPGDVVAVDDPLITLESDKAAMDVPATASGRVVEVLVRVGDRVSQGTPIVSLADSGGGTVVTGLQQEPRAEAAAPAEATEIIEPPAAPRTLPPPVRQSGEAKPHASPSVRRFARQLGVDLTRVEGSGPKARILKDDVTGFVKELLGTAPPAVAPPSVATIPSIPAVDFGKFGDIETRPLPRVKKLSGTHLHRCWLNVPHVTHHDEVDITDTETFRRSLKQEAERRGVRVTLLSFVMKAVAAALGEIPQFNASLGEGGDTLILKGYCHIGIAVDTPNGLVVPVFRDVDRKGVYELAAEMAEISARAREGKLRPEEMQGGCISISSLGGIGGTAFTPIVNAPEVAILGLTRSRMMPIWNGSEFVPRLMLPLDLSYDHRVIDGAEAARFVVFLAAMLADMRRLLL